MSNRIFLAFVFSCCAFEGHAASGVWTPPFTLSASPSSMSNDSPLAIDTHSNTIVGWLDGPFPTTSNDIFSAFLPAGTSTWNAPELIFTGTPPEFPSYPLMFTDLDDNQTALWGLLNITNSTSKIEASRRFFGSIGWPAPNSLNLSALTGGGSAEVGKFGNILAFLALTTGFSPPFAIAMSTLPEKSTTWSPLTILDQDNSSQPVLSSTISGGKAILVWRTNTPTLAVHSRRYSFPSGQFAVLADIPLPVGTTDLLSLFLDNDQQGDVVAFFTVTDGVSSMAYASTLLSGSSIWSTPILISNPSNSAFALSLGFSDARMAVLLWGEITSLSDGYIFSADLPVEGNPQIFQLQGPIANSTSLDQSSNVAVDAYGNAVAIWGTVASGVSSVYVDSKAKGGSWAMPAPLSLTGGSPKVVLSDQETAVAVWIDSVSGSLMTSANLALFDLNGPTNFLGKVVKDQFLNSTHYALKMHWNADPLVHIDRFEIRNNGNLVKVLPGTARKDVIYISSKHVNGAYTLTSIATNGNQSLPVTLSITK